MSARAQTASPLPAPSLGNKNRHILVVDDEFLIRYTLQTLLQDEGYTVATAGTGAQAMHCYEEQRPHIIVLDIRLPDINGLALLQQMLAIDPSVKVIMITASPDIPSSVEAIKNGAIDYLEKPLDMEKLKALLLSLYREAGAETASLPGSFVFKSPVMTEIYRIAERLANKSDVTMLVLGESGTGKSFLCKTLHELSSRRDKPFIEIGCSSIPEQLIESELFGHEKGSFTDAKAAKKGLIEIAEGGTVFFDEVGDMPYPMQAKLLALIEERKFRRIGGLQNINADIRIFAATNRNLYELVQAQKFRLDLYYRLNVVTLEMPPLRARADDIPLLVQYYLKNYSEKYKCGDKGMTSRAVKMLQKHPWPGNIRELKNLLEKLVILSKTEKLDIGDLPEAIRMPKEAPVMADTILQLQEQLPVQATLSLKAAEEGHIRKALLMAEGNQRKAAKLLDITRDTLRYRLKKLGIDSSQYSE